MSTAPLDSASLSWLPVFTSSVSGRTAWLSGGLQEVGASRGEEVGASMVLEGAATSRGLEGEVGSPWGLEQPSLTLLLRQLVSSVDTNVFNRSRYWLYSSTSLCPAPSTQSGSTALGQRS